MIADTPVLVATVYHSDARGPNGLDGMVLIPFQEEIGKSVKRSAVVVGIAALNPTHHRRSSSDVDHAEEVCFETPTDVRGRMSWLHDALGLAAGNAESDPADHKVARREKECQVAMFV